MGTATTKKVSPILEFILGSLTGAIANVGETKLEEVLQSLHDKNKTQYKAAIEGGRAFIEALQPLVANTGTKIDDALLSALSDAVETSAKANGIT